MSREYTFGLCLSHDVDRIYKTYQYVFDSITEKDPRKFAGYFRPKNPYWTFPRIMEIEQELGVRSSFNVLDEIHISQRPKSDWFSEDGWKLFAGRYDINDPQLVSQLRTLDSLGWEIALHGSYTSSENPERFSYEKERIESAIGTEIIGNRQHYWRISKPDTWKHLRDVGIKYDTSLGSSTEIDFQHGYELIRPFNDEFVVFPWSLMDGAVMQSGNSISEIKDNCMNVLQDAKANRSVLVADWHSGKIFYRNDRPNWGKIYKWMIEEAIDLGAWVGSPGKFYHAISHPEGTIEDALDTLSRHEDHE